MDEAHRLAAMRQVMRTLRSVQRTLPPASNAWRNDIVAYVIGSLQQEVRRLAAYEEAERVQQVLGDVLHLLSDAMPARGSLTISDSIVEKRSEALTKLDLAIQLIDIPSDSLNLESVAGSPQSLGTLPGMLVTVEAGSAPPKAIADLLSDLSVLYRRMGGSGINFTPQDVHVLAPQVQ